MGRFFIKTNGFIEQGHCTPDGEVASKTIISLNQEQIDNEASIVFHSFYYMCCY